MGTLRGWEGYRGKRSLEHYGRPTVVPIVVTTGVMVRVEVEEGRYLRTVIPASGRTKNGGRAPALITVASVFPGGLMAPSRGPEPIARALHATLENHKGPVHVARYARGSAKYVLTGGQDRTVRLWNPSLGTEIKSYSAHGYEVLSISV
jgi:hypothetical protein